MRADSAFSTFLRGAPVIRVSNLELLLPCDDVLFEAPNAVEWSRLVDSGYPITMPPINAYNCLDVLVANAKSNYYSLHAVLNYLQLRNNDAYQKLLEFQLRGSADFVVIPYQFYAMDSSAQSLPIHIVAFIASYHHILPNFPSDWQRSNVLVFWHFLCLGMTVNQDVFEIAAGREGSGPAANALETVAIWSKTCAARRAMIHAAHIFNLLSCRGSDDEPTIYASFATFAAGLAMTIYIFAGAGQQIRTQTQTQSHPISGPSSNAEIRGTTNGSQNAAAFELTSEIHWPTFGNVGLSDSPSSVPHANARPVSQTRTLSHTHAATSHPNSRIDSPNIHGLGIHPGNAGAANFIRNGGPFTFRGRILTGFPGAQFVLVLYADLLKDLGKWVYILGLGTYTNRFKGLSENEPDSLYDV